MRSNLFLSLSACFLMAACADHAGDVLVTADNPPPPVNQPDNGALTPNNQTGEQGPSGGSQGGSGGGAGGGGGQPVPEPGTLLLVGSGLAGAALLRRRRQAKA
jgi:hypothetical protein